MEWKVPLADLDFGSEEKEAVLSVLRNKWLTMGEVTQAFEKEFGQSVGEKRPLQFRMQRSPSTWPVWNWGLGRVMK